MMSFLIPALVFGSASALLMLLSLTTTFLLSPVMLLFTPLPIIYSSLRYHHTYGLLASLLASMILVVALNAFIALGYLIAIALPAWLVGLLFMHATPVRLHVIPAVGQTFPAAATTTSLKWFPLGTLTVIVACMAAVLLLVIGLLLAPSFQDFQNIIRDFVTTYLRDEPALKSELEALSGNGNAGRGIDTLVYFLPVMGAVMWMLSLLFNLWVAARLCLIQKVLRRPAPDFYSFALPRWAAMLFTGSFIISFLPALPGLIGLTLVFTVALCFAFLGLSVIHAGTQGVRGRGLILFSVYAFLLIQGWALLLVAVLGFIEHFASLRRRYFTAPPTPPAG